MLEIFWMVNISPTGSGKVCPCPLLPFANLNSGTAVANRVWHVRASRYSPLGWVMLTAGTRGVAGTERKLVRGSPLS